MVLIYLFRVLVVLFLILVMDFYAWQAFKTVAKESQWAGRLYWGSSVFVYVAIFYAFFKMAGNTDSFYPGFWVFGITLMVYTPKMILCGFLLIEDVYRLLATLYNRVAGGEEVLTYMPTRRKFISQLAISLAAIPFAGILYGMWRGKYNFQVNKINLDVPNLPNAFNGFKILQFSDFHAGSFTDENEVRSALALIQEQNADVIVFTGDMVNNKAKEFEPYVEMISELHAPFGKYSILGNHDYGDYVPWESPVHKENNLEQLKEMEHEAGFRLLLNEHVVFEEGGQHLALMGVENYGAPPFPQKGDLAEASRGLRAEIPRILLTHDPSHFDLEVKNSEQPIFLTLSGHTHGMQFGVEIPGWLKWSPVKWRYPKWAGLYEENGKYLYVNKGLGFIGYPGRVGMWPEITVIELNSIP